VRFKRGYKYQLFDTLSFRTPLLGESVVHEYFTLFVAGLMIIKRGYAWDGASGPAIDRDTNMRASLVHDVGCQMIAEGVLDQFYQPVVDKMYYVTALDAGMWKPIAWAEYRAIRLHFSTGKLPDKNPILEAP